MSKTTILFYGASVTHQSGLTGYFQHLTHNQNFNFQRLSYPSSQLFNAGFYNTRKIFEQIPKPQLVFLEWSTTGESRYELKTLNYILSQILQSNAVPIFLILPTKRNTEAFRESEKLLLAVSKSRNIPLLDLRHLARIFPLNEILRDEVHTTELGAENYSKEILFFLNNYKFPDPKLIIDIPMNDFLIASADQKYLLQDNGMLIFNFERSSAFSEIAMRHIVGPFSPIIEYFSDGQLIWEKNYLDQWCHYERENFNTLVPNFVLSKTKNQLILRISKKEPDFSIVQKMPGPYQGSKKLEILELFTCNLKNVDVVIV